MNFSEALEELKKGRCIYRKGWEDVGSYIFLISGKELEKYLFVTPTPCYDTIGKVCANGVVDLGYALTNIDLLSNDWNLK